MRPEEKLPRVSVCIQTYQQAPYIRECLESVIAQRTGFPFEIILGEDESTDGTREICIEYAEKYPGLIRLFLRTEKDRIYIDGEKTGRFNFIENLKAARGNYIATLDGDDHWIHPFKLQKQFELMEENPGCSLCFHKTLEQKGTSVPVVVADDPGEPVRFTGIHKIMSIVGRLTLHTSNCMLRSEYLKTIPEWFYTVPFLDVPLFTYVGSFGKIGFIPKTLSVYRVHEKGMWLSREEPGNYIKQWKLFTILCRNFDGLLLKVLQERRTGLGMDLILFYRKHRWYETKWMQEELSKLEFPGDEDLLALLNKPPEFGDYIFSAGAYSKKMFQKLKKAL
jgi:glycosyltransferase involved in cell wall biosynthesis